MMLDKKRILITGANGTLGSIISQKLYENNADLVLLYNKNDDQIKKLINYKNKIETHKIDLLDQIKLEETLRKITNEKSIDIFIHCPVLPIEHKSFLDNDWTDFQNHIELQTKSFIQISQHVVPLMKEKKYGKIIAILSSYLVGRPPPSLSPYIVSKYSLLGLLKILAIELGQYGITCNGVSPSMFESKLIETYPKKLKTLNSIDNPLKKLVTPEDISSTILFLCSELSNFVNGENIVISGGQVMH